MYNFKFILVLNDFIKTVQSCHQTLLKINKGQEKKLNKDFLIALYCTVKEDFEFLRLKKPTTHSLHVTNLFYTTIFSLVQ